MRDGCDVSNHRDLHTGRLQRAQSGLTTTARAFNLDTKGSNAVFLGLFRALFGRHLGCVGGGFSRPLKALLAGARPGNCVATDVGNGNDRIIEGRLDMSHSSLDILLDLLLSHCLLGCHIIF